MLIGGAPESRGRVQGRCTVADTGRMATMTVTQPRTRWSLVALALLVGLAAGALFSYYGISKDGTDTQIVAEPREFDSPRVADLPMQEAIEALVEDGYDVVAVGTRKVVLQELGFRGSVLRLRGEHGKKLRYCSQHFAACVPIRP